MLDAADSFFNYFSVSGFISITSTELPGKTPAYFNTLYETKRIQKH
jgi:hypothetical protein